MNVLLRKAATGCDVKVPSNLYTTSSQVCNKLLASYIDLYIQAKF